MNARVEEELIERIRTLPPERIDQVIDFVNFLATQEQKRKAGEALEAMWARAAHEEELTPEIEQMIVDEVRAARAERRAERERSANRS